nr:gamma-aminobutyric acid receptor subunit alpha-1-like [Penaeus vannamei]
MLSFASEQLRANQLPWNGFIDDKLCRYCYLGFSAISINVIRDFMSCFVIVAEMKYSMECYMRQYWSDERLKFNGPLDQLTLNIKMLEALWKPDTYFHNGLGSYVHMTTRPNKLIRINQNGDILYSMRLTIKAKCPMVLRNFPMDKQSCPLVISSFGYTDKEVRYEWAPKKVEFEEGMGLSQFDILNTKCTNYSVRWRSGKASKTRNAISHNPPSLERRITTPLSHAGLFSALQVNFNLSRSAGYFLIQVYVPCFLIVVLSWVSFWINREATSDRVGIGIITVLTLATISLDTRTDLPKVHYATALDWFILMSFGYCIATLLQFAGVHFFTKVGSGEIMAEEEEWEDLEIIEDCSPEVVEECVQTYDSPHDAACGTSVEGRIEVVFLNSNHPNCPRSAATLYATLNSKRTIMGIESDESEPPKKQHESVDTQNDLGGDGVLGTPLQGENILSVFRDVSNMMGESVGLYPSYPFVFIGVVPDIDPCTHPPLPLLLPQDAGVLNHAGDCLATFRTAETQTEKKERCWTQFLHCVVGDDQYRRERQRRACLQRSVNSVSAIDTVSRILFPASYGLLNLWYWYSYYDTELISNWSDPGFENSARQ